MCTAQTGGHNARLLPDGHQLLGGKAGERHLLAARRGLRHRALADCTDDLNSQGCGWSVRGATGSLVHARQMGDAALRAVIGATRAKRSDRLLSLHATSSAGSAKGLSLARSTRHLVPVCPPTLYLRRDHVTALTGRSAQVTGRRCSCGRARCCQAPRGNPTRRKQPRFGDAADADQAVLRTGRLAWETAQPARPRG